MSFLVALPTEKRNSITFDFQAFLILIISAVFGVCLMIFTAMHLGLILSNRTTIESMEGSGYIKFENLSSGETQVISLKKNNIYHLGSKRLNFNQVFGKEVKNWFNPFNGKQFGDGHNFEINEKVYNKLKETYEG
ncbi:hypothetical protein HDU92_001806 [Lobulomyces angularis]|nr:hypothetical protein HDU92_001806 [Lobulomyces angularis]